MQYPRIIDDAFSGISISMLVAMAMWENIMEKLQSNR